MAGSTVLSQVLGLKINIELTSDTGTVVTNKKQFSNAMAM